MDARADLYALGAMLYEMVAGKHMFSKDGSMPLAREVGELHLHAEVEPLTEMFEQFPPAFWAIVKKALAKKREDRFPSAAEMAREMRAEKLAIDASGRGRFLPRSRPKSAALVNGLPFRAAKAEEPTVQEANRRREVTADLPAEVRTAVPIAAGSYAMAGGGRCEWRPEGRRA